jgi:hypothetical protein
MKVKFFLKKMCLIALILCEIYQRCTDSKTQWSRDTKEWVFSIECLSNKTNYNTAIRSAMVYSNKKRKKKSIWYEMHVK